MKHSFLSILIDSKNGVIFASVKNYILCFDLTSGKLVDSWEDDVSTDYTIKQKFKNIEQPETKKQKTNNLKPKAPKIPTPGTGAPVIYNDIRNLHLSQSGRYLLASSNSDKAVVVFDLNEEGKLLTLVKRQPFPKRPSAIRLADDKDIVVADKFGDVYKVALAAPVIADFASESAILGHVSMLTQILLEDNKIITADRDEHIRVSSYPSSHIIDRWLFGHREFVSLVVVPSFNRDLMISGGGDEFLAVWKWKQDADNLVQKLPLRELAAPFLTEAHSVPVRWVKTEQDKQRRELTVGDICVNDELKKLLVLIEQTKVVLVFKYLESGTFEFEKLIEAKHLITFIDSVGKKLVYGVESGDANQLINFVDLETFQEVDQAVAAKIAEESTVDVEGGEVYPLYVVNSLRKRSEH